MVGPVWYQEMLLGGRRGRLFLFRYLFAAWLLVQLFFYVLATLFFGILMARGHWDRNLFAETARSYLELLVAQQFVLLGLATPALAAGAVTDEKARGTLQYLLTADLRPWEIVVGKLLGRSYQALLLAVTGLPLLCFFGVFGGLTLGLLLTIGVSSAAFVFALAAGGLLASVWCRHTRDAVISLYAVVVIGYAVLRGLRGWLDDLAAAAQTGGGSGEASPLATGLAGLLSCLDPFYALRPGWTLDPAGAYAHRAFRSVLAWLVLGSVCVLLAAWRLRGAYLRQLEGEGKQRKPRWWRARRPAVGDNPLRWKERHVEGVAPLAFFRGMPRWLGLLLVFAATMFSSAAILLNHLPPGETGATIVGRLVHLDAAGLLAVAADLSPASEEFFGQGVAVLLLAGVVIGIRCSGAVTGERERQTWEALLLTPMETRELIRGKLWGIVGASYPYLLAYAVPALGLATLGGLGALFWTSLWLAVTWLALFYVGAAGVWCSVRSKGSWRSLLGTLAFTYLGGFVLYLFTAVVAAIVALILVLLLMLLQVVFASLGGPPPPRGMVWGAFGVWTTAFRFAVCITLAGVFILLAWMLVRSAEYRVGILERTKHWRNEPRRPRLRPVRPVRDYD
jgi:ABC-type transport system involved in multi-copper enzyme maturation permease subunit